MKFDVVTHHFDLQCHNSRIFNAKKAVLQKLPLKITTSYKIRPEIEFCASSFVCQYISLQVIRLFSHYLPTSADGIFSYSGLVV